jgi:hypothetical protein
MSPAQWLDLLLSTEAPALPAPWLMQLGLAVGWALVLGSAGVGVAGNGSLRNRRWLAAVLVLWTLLPGPLSPDFWLGLAFQSPSLSAMLLGGWYLQRALWPASADTKIHRSVGFWQFPAVLLGYVLLLDTFAVLPLQVYGWGFSPLLLLLAMALGLLPWLLRGRDSEGEGVAHWLVPAAVLLFAATRLPTGNLWDALLDPWLWLLLQVAWLRQRYRSWRA